MQLRYLEELMHFRLYAYSIDYTRLNETFYVKKILRKWLDS